VWWRAGLVTSDEVRVTGSFAPRADAMTARRDPDPAIVQSET
jgi:hypothetical protein